MKLHIRKIILIFMILLISFACVLIFVNKNIFYSRNLQYFFEDYIQKCRLSKNLEIETDEVIANDFINFNGDLAVASKSKFMILSHDLKKLLEINHNFRLPIVKSSKFKSLLFDTDGNNYMVTTKSKVLYKGEMESKIITGKISEGDNIILLTESDEYCCEIYVLSIDGELKYKYCFAKMYCTDVAINDDGSKVAVCGLKSEEGAIKSVIQIFDFKSETPIFTKGFENNKFLLINFFDNSNLIAIGDNVAVSIKNLGEKINDIDYSNKRLCLYDFDKNFGILLSFSATRDERNQHIIVLNKDFKQVSEIETDKKFKSIALKNREIFALSESLATIYNLFGKIKKQKKVPTSCRKILPAGHSKIYILGNNIIKTIK